MSTTYKPGDSCRHCLYFHPVGDIHNDATGNDEAFGECRVAPPTTHTPPEPATMLTGAFPQILAIDWCGAFEWASRRAKGRQ